MKKVKYIFYSLCLFGLLYSCEKDIATYDDGSAIYFDMSTDDTLTYSWGLIESDVREAVLTLRVNLFGKVTDYPRKFTIRVVSNFPDSVKAEEGVNYRSIPLEYEMPPMSDHAEIPITLLRDDAKSATYFEIFLEPNDEFDFRYMRWVELTDSEGNVTDTVMYDDHRVIKQDEKFPRPSWWNVQEEWVGEWSETKAELMCEVMNIDRNKFQLALDSDGALTHAQLRFVAIQMAYYFYENETYDENGVLIEMGESAYNY